MKKILLMSLVLLVTSLVGKEKEPKFLQLKGSFLNETNITYVIYKLDNEKNTYVQEKIAVGKNSFTAKCEKDHKYLIEFETVTHEIKFLVVHVTITGKFYIDVDFADDHSAQLEFSKNRYKLTAINQKKSINF
jgi:hypothetical protein